MKKFLWGFFTGIAAMIVFLYFGGAKLLDRIALGARHTEVGLEQAGEKTKKEVEEKAGQVEKKATEVKEKAGQAVEKLKP